MPPLSKQADAARKREERGAEARAQEKLALQSEAKPAKRHQPREVDACCAKIMNEFVELSGKPPTLKEIREVILLKVNEERQLQNKPPILESTLVTHIRKWKESAGYTWAGRKHQKTEEDSPEIRDLMNFQQQLARMADLRVCAVCGEERGKYLFPTTLTYDPKDDFFRPMDSGSKRQLILVDQNSDGTVLVCSRCSAELRKGERPKWAVQFEPADKRLTQLTDVEFRMIRPVVPIVRIIRLPGEGQLATNGGSINFFNDALGVASRLPRLPQYCDLIAVAMPATSAALANLR